MKNPVLTACKSQHYTFAEIMMVVAIFIIILAMIMTAWMSSGNKVRLNNAARLVSAQLNMARSMAIKERKNIEVVFKGGPDYKMLVKAEDVSENDAPKDNWIALPGGTVFTTTKPGTSTQTAAWNSGTKVVFTKDGSVESGSIEDFYVAVGNQTNRKVSANQPYYTININNFSGRITLQYKEDD